MMKGVLLAGMLAIASITPNAQAAPLSRAKKIYDGVTSWPMRLLLWGSLIALAGYTMFGVYTDLQPARSQDLRLRTIITKYMDEYHLVYCLYTMCVVAGVVGLGKSGQALWDGLAHWCFLHCCAPCRDPLNIDGTMSSMPSTSSSSLTVPSSERGVGSIQFTGDGQSSSTSILIIQSGCWNNDNLQGFDSFMQQNISPSQQEGSSPQQDTSPTEHGDSSSQYSGSPMQRGKRVLEFGNGDFHLDNQDDFSDSSD